MQISPEIVNLVNQQTQGTGIPPSLIIAQLQQESGFNPNAVSSAGAAGISQFIPSTARAYGLKVGNGVDDRFDPVKSVNAQIAYMKDLYQKYGTLERALSAYNSGKPDAYLNPSFAKGQTTNYVKSIMGNYNNFANKITPVQQQTQQPQSLIRKFIPSVTTVSASGLPPKINQPMGQYTVRPGDSLSSIAKQYLGDASKYTQLSGYRSGNPNLIFPGEKISW